jgi:hypothetical protein
MDAVMFYMKNRKLGLWMLALLISVFVMPELSQADTTHGACLFDPLKFSSAAKSQSSDNGSLDTDIDYWERARADYQRDLDYSQVFIKKQPGEWPAKRYLVESRFYVSTARDKAVQDNDIMAAKQDLRVAVAYLHQGFELSTSQERTSIAPVANDIMSITKI